MEPTLSPDVLAQLRQVRPYPAVSLLMPTHRGATAGGQDPIRLRNLVHEAKERIEADPAVSRESRIAVGKQLDQAVQAVDLVYAEDSLAIFAAPDEYHVWKLGRPAPERVVLSDTFLTRNLVAAQAAERPYWVLALSADRVALWGGNGDHLHEEHIGAFPLTRSLEPESPQRKEQIGDRPSTFRDEDARHFMKDADQAMAAVLAKDPRPLYVVGEGAAFRMLEDVGQIAGQAVAHAPQGGLAHGPAESLRKAVQPLAAAWDEKRVTEVQDRLSKARDTRQFAAGIDEARQNVNDRRVAVLAVEENFWTVVHDQGEHLAPAEPGAEGTREDMVDELIEQALDSGAEVHFLPDGTLDGMDRIACILRY
ncbi:MAG: chemotaxis protein [Kitasatospora sp.]|jgi:hypothetical protein|nr:chemotaxis protein [Kitasatospora sp.]